MSTCEHCQTAFTPVGLYGKRAQAARYCSRPCAARAKAAQRRAAWNPQQQAAADRTRFHAKVAQAATCWRWLGSLDDKGYGKFSVARSRWRYAHHAAWFFATGQWPTDGEVIGHTCDSPGCTRNDDTGTYTVNGVDYPRVGHLFLAPSNAANNADMWAKGRGLSGDRHQNRQHPERMARGERAGHAKLRDAEVLAIRADYATGGVSMAALGRRHLVSPATINKIVKRQRWRHI